VNAQSSPILDILFELGENSALFGVFFLEPFYGRGVFLALGLAGGGFGLEFFLGGVEDFGGGVELVGEGRDLGVTLGEHGVKEGLLLGDVEWHGCIVCFMGEAGGVLVFNGGIAA